MSRFPIHQGPKNQPALQLLQLLQLKWTTHTKSTSQFIRQVVFWGDAYTPKLTATTATQRKKGPTAYPWAIYNVQKGTVPNCIFLFACINLPLFRYSKRRKIPEAKKCLPRTIFFPAQKKIFSCPEKNYFRP